jgi:hypothetical protein
LLQKHVEKYETQQKALEVALESLENSSKQSPALTLEEKLWMRLKSVKSLCIIEKNAFKLLLETADFELLEEFYIQNKPLEYAIEYYFQKPLKECSLKEVIDGLVIYARTSNRLDTVNCTDESDHYTLIITHSMGLNASKLNIISFESVFKTYGVKTECIISTKTNFLKIFKNEY